MTMTHWVTLSMLLRRVLRQKCGVLWTWCTHWANTFERCCYNNNMKKVICSSYLLLSFELLPFLQLSKNERQQYSVRTSVFPSRMVYSMTSCTMLFLSNIIIVVSNILGYLLAKDNVVCVVNCANFEVQRWLAPKVVGTHDGNDVQTTAEVLVTNA